MAIIVTRAGKGDALSFVEGDANFNNLNTDKLEKNGGTLTGYKEVIFSLGTTNAPAVNAANGNVQSITITSGLALPLFSSPSVGQSVTLLVTGTGTITNAAGYIFAAGAKTLTSKSIVSIFYDGTTYWTSVSTNYQ
jgi:hypothetical protein